MGKRRVELKHIGRGHTKGDIVVWLPEERVLFSGDLVEFGATPYTGDAYLSDWPQTLANVRALGAEKLVPGRGDALTTPETVEAAISGTQEFLTQMFESVKQGRAAGKELNQIYTETYQVLQPQFGHWVIFDHCLPFDITRAYDEAGDYPNPRIWTAERDTEMWHALQDAL
jgi:glyoxylase-like metal-dependent hydrolase (beta-lactamase superfamily II)